MTWKLLQQKQQHEEVEAIKIAIQNLLFKPKLFHQAVIFSNPEAAIPAVFKGWKEMRMLTL